MRGLAPEVEENERRASGVKAHIFVKQLAPSVSSEETSICLVLLGNALPIYG